MSTYGYLQRMKYEGQKREREAATEKARTRALEDKQMALLDAEIANLQSDPASGNAAIANRAQAEATKYLGKWNKALNKAEGVYSTAISEVGKAGALIDRAYSDVGELDDIGQEIKGEWDQFKTTFQDTQGQLLEGAGEAIGQRGQLRRQFMDLARSDEEGAAGRAMADVAGASEQGRRAEAMRMQGMGIDPTSGRSRSFMRESRDQQALASTMAAGKARRGEKERVAGLTAQGLQLIDPSKDISAASQIQQLSSNLLAQRSQMATTKAGLRSDLARSRGAVAQTTAGIASGQARDIAGQFGEYGAAQQGVAYGAAPKAGTTSGAGTISQYAASLGVTGFENQNDPISDKVKSHLQSVKKGQDMKSKFYG